MREPQGVVDYKEGDVNNTVAIEPKLDGWSGIARWHDGVPVLYSRNGTELPLPHIQRELALLMPKGFFFHGELTHHEGFEAMKSAIAQQSEDIQYHVFDMVFDEFFDDGIDMRMYSARREALEDLFAIPEDVPTLGEMRDNVHLVPMSGASPSTIETFHLSLLELGYEGSVVKRMDSPYESGPTGAWMRIKPVTTVDCVIIGVERSKTDLSRASSVIVCDADGITTNVHAGLSMDFLREAIEHPARLMDQVMEVEHHGTYRSGKMRNASCVRMRPDKTADQITQGVLL